MQQKVLILTAIPNGLRLDQEIREKVFPLLANYGWHLKLLLHSANLAPK